MGNVRIVNLSSLHRLHPITTGIEAFVALSQKYYTQSRWLPFFTSYVDKAWLGFQYAKHTKMIDQYKLGKLTAEHGQTQTMQFLTNLLDVLAFMRKENVRSEDKARLLESQAHFLSLKGKETPVDDDLKLALLEEAWNSILSFTEDDQAKVEHLLQNKEESPVYLISNTNELNVHRILAWLREILPGQVNENIDLSVTDSTEPVEVVPNVFLCVSYRFGAYKTPADQPENSTMSLVRCLVEQVLPSRGYGKAQMEIISQFPKDCQEAEALGVSAQAANGYYPPARPAQPAPP